MGSDSSSHGQCLTNSEEEENDGRYGEEGVGLQRTGNREVGVQLYSLFLLIIG